TCMDHARNEGESDVDCGGPCPKCSDGKKCANVGDCASGVCVGGACAAPSCMDRVKNGTETDRDCGGACPPCGDGQSCGAGSDCASGLCLGGSCAPLQVTCMGAGVTQSARRCVFAYSGVDQSFNVTGGPITLSVKAWGAGGGGGGTGLAYQGAVLSGGGGGYA